MATSSPGARTRVLWSVQSVQLAGRTLEVARLRVKLHLRSALAGQQTIAEWAWLDSGAPFSVIPRAIHQGRLRWQALAGVQTIWAGQACDLGTIEVWPPGRRRAQPQGPFPMLAKFARSDPPGGPIPVLLGLEFLLTHQARFELRPPPTGWAIHIP